MQEDDTSQTRLPLQVRERHRHCLGAVGAKIDDDQIIQHY
jgi:hypothetical protein